MTRKDIDEELKALKENGMTDVEHGFRPEEFGINAELEFYTTLMALQCTFVHKSEIINPPIQEVW